MIEKRKTNILNKITVFSLEKIRNYRSLTINTLSFLKSGKQGR